MTLISFLLYRYYRSESVCNAGMTKKGDLLPDMYALITSYACIDNHDGTSLYLNYCQESVWNAMLFQNNSVCDSSDIYASPMYVEIPLANCALNDSPDHELLPVLNYTTEKCYYPGDNTDVSGTSNTVVAVTIAAHVALLLSMTLFG